jgi:holo-[acyl-carrier protein] synthase
VAVIGVGIDVVPVSRVQEMMDRHGDRLMERMFTPREREIAGTRAQTMLHLAGRIAAKEATYKALSAQGAEPTIGWHDLEVTRLEDGRPAMVLHGAALERFRALGATRCMLSLSHDGGIAAAVCLIE